MANDNPFAFLPGAQDSSTANLAIGGTSIPKNPFSGLTGGSAPSTDPFASIDGTKTNSSLTLPSGTGSGTDNSKLSIDPTITAPTPFDSSTSGVVTTSSGAKTKVGALSNAITSLDQAQNQSGGYTKDSAGNVYDSTGKYVSLDSLPKGSDGNPTLNLQNLPVGPFSGGAPKSDSSSGSGTSTQPFDTQNGTILPPGIQRDQNGMLFTLDPSTGAKTVVGYNSGGTNYNSNGTLMTTSPTVGSGNLPPASETNPQFPTAPVIGQYTPAQQAQIDAAAATAGSAFDPLISTAQENARQGEAKQLVNAGEKGGFMNTQYSGLAALVPDNAKSFVGAGGQLEQQKSAYDTQINSLQIQKANAIATAKSAMQQYIDTGNQTAYENATKAYQAAVDANKAQQDAVAQKSQIAYQQAQTDALKNTQVNQLAKDQQDYLYQQMAKYPSAFKSLSADDIQNLTPGKINTLITGSQEYKDEILKNHNDALKAGASLTGSSGGVYQPGANPTVDSWVQNVLNGNATLASVPSALRSAVSLGITDQPTTSYSPLASSRFATASNRIVQNYVDLPLYQAVANGQLYIDRINQATSNPGSVSDQSLLDAFTKLDTGGQAISDAQVKLLTDGQSYADTIGVFANKLQNGGVLSNSQRQQLSTLANAVFKNYQKDYTPIYTQATSQLQAAGIPKAFWTIPDLNTLSKPASDAPVTQNATIDDVTQTINENASQYNYDGGREALIAAISAAAPNLSKADISAQVYKLIPDKK